MSLHTFHPEPPSHSLLLHLVNRASVRALEERYNNERQVSDSIGESTRLLIDPLTLTLTLAPTLATLSRYHTLNSH